ncbi:MAG: hypothetical protein A2V70_09810 [Planctomycetes bacterium RBG_13_63_9]|nr:MAG: hypothetical protein A2V70_09810 [Planctomycetes bacterium RBG_13_63_9]
MLAAVAILLLVISASTIAAETASVDQLDVCLSGQHGYHTYRIPSLIVTNKATVLAFCEGRRNGRGDSGDIDLLLRRSTDGGLTFSRQEIVWDDGPNTCGNPCPVLDAETGTVWLLLTHNLGTDREPDIIAQKSKGTRTVWVSHSTDDGLSWSKPLEITEQTKMPDWTWYATGPGAGIQLGSGRLVVPCDHMEAGTRAFGAHVIYSDDHGQTWKLGGTTTSKATAKSKVNECEVIERADGSLLLNMRNYDRRHKCRAVATSPDGGLTFSEVSYDETLVEPICQASIRRYPSPTDPGKNRVLFSNPADKVDRRRITVRLSDDDAKRWSVSKVLWPGPAAYSCLAVLPDGTILCLYERGTQHPSEKITLARFTLEWLSDGKDR